MVTVIKEGSFLKACVHRISNIALNREAPESKRIYTCIRCGRIVKPVKGLGCKGVTITLILIMAIYTNIPWFILFPTRYVAEWTSNVLYTIGVGIMLIFIDYIAIRFFVPVCRIVRNNDH